MKGWEQPAFFVLSVVGIVIGTWKNLEAFYEVYEPAAAARTSIRVHASEHTPSLEETIESEVDEVPMAD